MIVVTGGAGFIGSAIIWGLNLRGYKNIIVVDCLRSGASIGSTSGDERWKNLARLKFEEFIDKEEFIRELERGRFNNVIEGIIHMGAESSTIADDSDFLMENNYEYTKRVALWCINNRKRFIYASTAATYGDGKRARLLRGRRGFSDEHFYLPRLTPLNLYAYSKHLFDLWAYRQGFLESIAGLKFFNCFGPNEYHKWKMRSMVLQAFEQIRRDGRVYLFKSYNSDYKDGYQMRDFIYIKDVVDMTLFIYEKREANGIFNIGTGKASSFYELVSAVFECLGKKVNIKYIDMPHSIKGKYQYFTQADITKLRKAGYSKRTYTLKEAVTDYLKNYLVSDEWYLG